MRESLLIVVACAVLVPLLRAGTVNYTYDAAGRLVAADYGTNRTASYAYDNAGNLLLSSMPAPAIVSGQATNGQATLYWPAAPGGFTLQRTFALGAAANWVDTGITPLQVGNLLVATVPAGPSAIFYRLRK